MLNALVNRFRMLIRLLQTGRDNPTYAQRLVRAIVLIPTFGTLLVILRIASACGARPQFIATTAGGVRLSCAPPDLVQMYIWLFEIWEPDLSHLVSTRLRNGDGFVDVGANIGYFALLASEAVGTTGPVTAIEASPEVFRHLQDTVARNGKSGIRLVNKAASDKPGQVTVYGGPAHNIGLTTTVVGRGFSRQATIEALPLDIILSEGEFLRARMVKIDVEGGEVAVLEGMNRLIREGRRDLEILVELSPQWWSDPSKTPRAVLQPAIDAGFNVYLMSNNYWPWRYLWPRRVDRPRRMRDLSGLDLRPKRLDVVLSRFDADVL